MFDMKTELLNFLRLLTYVILEIGCKKIMWSRLDQYNMEWMLFLLMFSV